MDFSLGFGPIEVGDEPGTFDLLLNALTLPHRNAKMNRERSRGLA